MRRTYTFLITVQSKALITTEWNKIFSGQQPRQLVERRVNRRFENLLCSRHQRNWIQMFWWEHRKFYWIFLLLLAAVSVSTLLSVKQRYPTCGKLFGTKKLTLGF